MSVAASTEESTGAASTWVRVCPSGRVLRPPPLAPDHPSSPFYSPPPVRYGHYGTVAERQISPFTQSKAVLSITAQRETDPLFLLHFSASGIARQMRLALLFHSNWGEEIVSFPSQRVGNSCCLLSPTPWRKEKKVYACGQYKYFLAASSKVQHWVCPKRGTGVRKVRLFTEHAS